jgi:hypothetical protein
MDAARLKVFVAVGDGDAVGCNYLTIALTFYQSEP